MNAVKLLVYRDVLHIWHCYRPVGLLCWGYLLLLVIKTPSALPHLFYMSVYFFIIGLAQEDENPAVCRVYGALPISRRQYVEGRYGAGYLMMAAYAVYACIACPAANYVQGRKAVWLPHLIVGICVGLVLMSLYLPPLFLLGAEKMRGPTLLLFGLIVTGSLIHLWFFQGKPTLWEFFADKMTLGRAVTALSLCLLASFLSLDLTRRFYKYCDRA